MVFIVQRKLNLVEGIVITLRSFFYINLKFSTILLVESVRGEGVLSFNIQNKKIIIYNGMETFLIMHNCPKNVTNLLRTTLLSTL